MSTPHAFADRLHPPTGYQRPRRQPTTIHPAARRLNALFPGATAWYGTHTGTWWAVLRGGDRLLEAATAEALEQLLAALLPGQKPPPTTIMRSTVTAPAQPSASTPTPPPAPPPAPRTAPPVSARAWAPRSSVSAAWRSAAHGNPTPPPRAAAPPPRPPDGPSAGPPGYSQPRSSAGRPLTPDPTPYRPERPNPDSATPRGRPTARL
ncbi:hypothetical protein GCM10009834_09770 [Streptomonospora arabica]